jgi:uncharacterized protein YgbK (DUF1537 family)
MLLGCIADDFTGATDLANNLVRNGMRTVQTIGLPPADLNIDADAIVVALKSRTIEPSQAVAQSLEALQWLQAQQCTQFYFKYCSTFDSTAQGNIGPVTEALMDALQTDFTIACPAFPEAGRTIFKGHLFVGDQLLAESGMKDHPLTPMTDSNLLRVMQAQCKKHQVGLIDYQTLAAGEQATRDAIVQLRSEGIGVAIADSLHDADLKVLAAACSDLPLLTAGSGVAIGLPENFKRAGTLQSSQSDALVPVAGPAVVISGSCSQATLGQVAHFSTNHPSFQIDPLALATDASLINQAISVVADAHSNGQTPMIYASANPDSVRAVQDKLGREQAGTLIEDALADIAQTLQRSGTKRFVVAGGETSGAVVNALSVNALRIGPQIDPGVPWTTSVSDDPLAIALKSGNFGSVDFFEKSLSMLDQKN